MLLRGERELASRGGVGGGKKHWYQRVGRREPASVSEGWAEGASVGIRGVGGGSQRRYQRGGRRESG